MEIDTSNLPESYLITHCQTFAFLIQIFIKNKVILERKTHHIAFWKNL
jgi:hypothetical protein